LQTYLWNEFKTWGKREEEQGKRVKKTENRGQTVTGGGRNKKGGKLVPRSQRTDLETTSRSKGNKLRTQAKPREKQGIRREITRLKTPKKRKKKLW